MALRKVKGNFERMFDKNLTDLVRGIRNNKENEAKYIAHCIEEIKQELRQDNVAVKANAVAKLTYLQMLGYDISWAGFNIIEVMSSTKFTHKRIGYLAASQSFHADTELLMLTTNMIRKDLNSQNQYDAGLALSGLSCFISPDLARDLVHDIMTLLTSTKPYLRKKAVLMMYKVFLRFPEALRPAFPRLKEKLEDPDSGVQSAAVNVVCELARKNPKNYLSLAPVFFKLMTTSTNNWMLIKIIKLFGALTPLEPRLGRKLIEPLTNLIHSTSAMSLLYECINTVIAVLISISSGMPSHSDSIQLCVQKLRILIEDSDQNLKYLGLLAMSKILRNHPKSVQSHKDLIMQCLDDKDETIRLRALDLLYGMVSKKNLMEIVKKLMVHMDKAEGTMYRDELLSKIIQICSQNNYHFITYFEWYISVLVELTRMEGTKHGPLVATQLLDVTIRVQAIRKYAVQQCALLLENSYLLTGQPRATMSEVLYAAAWICGEFSSELEDPLATLQSLLRSQASSLPGHIQAVYVHNILKLAASTFAKAEKEENTETMEKICGLKDKIATFVCSGDLEVQERSSSALVLLECLKENPGLAQELIKTFEGELNPVAPKAQRKVPIPENLDLDSWINDPPSESSDSEDLDMNDIFIKTEKPTNSFSKRDLSEPSLEELERRREARKLEQENNPHYLKGSFKTPTSYHNSSNVYEDFENIPVAELDIPISLKISNSHRCRNVDSSNKRHKKHEKKKKSKKNKNKKSASEEDEKDDSLPLQVVNTGIGELPPGAQISDSDEYDLVDANDPHRALNIDLDMPLREDERLPVLEHRVIENAITKKVEEKENKKEKGRKKSKRKVKNVVENKVNDEKESSDLWLETSSSPEKVQSPAIGEYIEVSSESQKDGKRKKSKSQNRHKKSNEEDAKHRKSKKSKSKKENKSLDYEETAGISTPSKEILPELKNDIMNSEYNAITVQQDPYEELAKNKVISMRYELRQIPHDSSKVIVSICITNISQPLVKELVFDVPDTSSLKLVRNTGDEFGIKLPFQLPLQSSKETEFIVLISDVTFAQRLRGTLTYMYEGAEGTQQEKLDFTVPLSCSNFMVGHLSHKDILTELLKSGQLVSKIRREITPSKDFDAVLNDICRKCNLTLVEQIDDTASLYGHSLKGHHVCLLLKYNRVTENLVIEGKGDNNSLLSGIGEEILRILT
ncbi:PREDICTED: AP-3 complex subunit delta-1 [Vollenhovia emeryi]|uniref:AP-3 complex subunit delta-1 n=1 Tax=Vollenhovia emeryi TaxID=411798 RepID=UPI0005F4B813|nr:PREDICTED: AP-3 complex subunit delta-1 [Vollenhovia emeryi]XP_011864110.1 PREDICTED: AP-3 complex subunit delta-1 [Vollenhovia emeryi]